MKNDVNYGSKQQHGLHWGISEFIAPGWRVGLVELGGSCQRLKEQDLSNCKTTVITLGNIWAHKDPQEAKLFRHPNEYSKHGVRWFCWDNPQLPHLLYRGPHNPQGHKNWMRITEGDTVTTTATPIRPGQSGAERINQQLRDITEGKIQKWWQIVGERKKKIEARGKTVLVCPSGAGIFPYYYGINKADWIAEKINTLKDMGYNPVLRDKPSRKSREINDNRLYQLIEREEIAFTVSIHSVVPVETLVAGIPAVVEGRHASGELGTPWEEFVATNKLRSPEREQVDAWVDRILMDTHHKTEAYEGKWYG
jgi:hypothetical protein